MQRLRPLLALLLFTVCWLDAHTQKFETGRATYYSKRAHGHRTSNGEIYHMDSLTCAHRRYPFGTRLLVRDLSNDSTVVVRVTDRGPFSKAIIDLSYAAARRLNMLSRGVARVEIVPYDSVFHTPYKLEAEPIPHFTDGEKMPDRFLPQPVDSVKPQDQ